MVGRVLAKDEVGVRFSLPAQKSIKYEVLGMNRIRLFIRTESGQGVDKKVVVSKINGLKSCGKRQNWG